MRVCVQTRRKKAERKAQLVRDLAAQCEEKRVAKEAAKAARDREDARFLAHAGRVSGGDDEAVAAPRAVVSPRPPQGGLRPAPGQSPSPLAARVPATSPVAADRRVAARTFTWPVCLCVSLCLYLCLFLCICVSRELTCYPPAVHMLATGIKAPTAVPGLDNVLDAAIAEEDLQPPPSARDAVSALRMHAVSPGRGSPRAQGRCFSRSGVFLHVSCVFDMVFISVRFTFTCLFVYCPQLRRRRSPRHLEACPGRTSATCCRHLLPPTTRATSKWRASTLGCCTRGRKHHAMTCSTLTCPSSWRRRPAVVPAKLHLLLLLLLLLQAMMKAEVAISAVRIQAGVVARGKCAAAAVAVAVDRGVGVGVGVVCRALPLAKRLQCVQRPQEEVARWLLLTTATAAVAAAATTPDLHGRPCRLLASQRLGIVSVTCGGTCLQAVSTIYCTPTTPHQRFPCCRQGSTPSAVPGDKADAIVELADLCKELLSEQRELKQALQRQEGAMSQLAQSHKSIALDNRNDRDTGADTDTDDYSDVAPYDDSKDPWDAPAPQSGKPRRRKSRVSSSKRNAGDLESDSVSAKPAVKAKAKSKAGSKAKGRTDDDDDGGGGGGGGGGIRKPGGKRSNAARGGHRGRGRGARGRGARGRGARAGIVRKGPQYDSNGHLIRPPRPKPPSPTASSASSAYSARSRDSSPSDRPLLSPAAGRRAAVRSAECVVVVVVTACVSVILSYCLCHSVILSLSFCLCHSVSLSVSVSVCRPTFFCY